MNRARWLATLSLLPLVAARCDPQTHAAPQPCDAIAPIANLDVPEDAVWGFADLHAHPAIEVAFGHRLVWGKALDDAPVDATELPAIDACPVETHDPSATSPLARAVGSKVFPPLSALGGFAHAPVGSAAPPGSTAWPNARDVIHQIMNVSSIRRAYEGGLRLMFASATDDQAISALLEGPNAANGFVPDPDADYVSARAQLDLIERIVSQNASWMQIVEDPSSARDAIRHGKLAIVMSLEMEGLRERDVDTLYRDYGVRHIIPIHLVDNDIGGTAANGDLFNAASAAESSLYRDDGKSNRYMDVQSSPDADRVMGWPIRIGTLTPAPLYADLDPIAYTSYRDLCYEPLASCAGTSATDSSFIELGQVNLRGLCRTKEECLGAHNYGADRIRHLLGKRMFVDVSHMSRQSVKETLDVEDGFPFMASHGDVTHLCAGSAATCRETQPQPRTERALDGEFARKMLANDGVLGLGTSVGNYQARAAVAARGGPLFTLDASHTSGCVGNAPGCAPLVAAEVAPTNVTIDTLRVVTRGGIGVDTTIAAPFARVVMRSRVADWQFQKHVFVQPLACSAEGCMADVALGARDELVPVASASGPSCATSTCGADIPCGTTSYTVDDVESVTIEWEYLACGDHCTSSELVPNQCRTTWGNAAAPMWTVNEVIVRGRKGPDLRGEVTIADGVRGDGAPLAVLGKARGSLALYERADRRDTTQAEAVPASGHLLKLSLRAAPGANLAGASAAQHGANVCVAVRQTESASGTCAAAPQIPDGASDCPAGWVSLNQRGQWTGDDNVELFTFARITGDESSICGLDMKVLDWPSPQDPFAVDEARIDVIEDPVAHWVRRYAAISKLANGERLGGLAFGTDANGLNGMMDISEQAAPSDALLPAICRTAGAGTRSTLAPMRIVNRDGSLGYGVRIDERGLGTYGMLADMVAIIGASSDPCARDVYQSLMLSAEATIRAWEKIINGAPHGGHAALPIAPNHFTCASP